VKDHVVRVDSGKYTFVRSLGGIRILRHGEPWHEQTEAGNALSSIMAELDAARVVVAAVRTAIAMGLVKSAGIDAALAKHAALVDDREPPSEWACPAESTP